MSRMPSEEESRQWDERARERRREFIAWVRTEHNVDLRYQYPPGRGPAPAMRRGPVGRLAVKAALQARLMWWGWLLEDGHRDLFVRMLWRSWPEQEARVLARWRMKRARWLRTGCPPGLPPWAAAQGVAYADGAAVGSGGVDSAERPADGVAGSSPEGGA